MSTLFYIIIETLKESASIYYQYWWLFTPVALWPVFEISWVYYVQEKYVKSITWNLLEIRVSKETERRPKTMEEFFSALYATYDAVIDTLYDIYLGGVVDIWFSLEIVASGGNINFYIRTPTEIREFVEAQLYSQYPDAEIKEVEDYVTNVPDDIPSNDYDLWGTDMVLQREDAYPIKTYKEFEDASSGEFIDPISNIIEGASKLENGEQIWIQFLIRAADDSWKEDANRLTLKLIGRDKKKETVQIKDIPGIIIEEIVDIGRYIILGFFSVVKPVKKEEEKTTTEEEPVSMMLHLSPGEKDIVTAIDESAKKSGFETDIRWIYLAKRDIFDKGKGNSIVFSYFSQFGTKDLNSFIPDPRTKTSAYYFLTNFRKAYRKRRILWRYKRREFDEKGYVLNTEELATLFHFPTFEVAAPLVPRIEAKKSRPPEGLPI